MYVYRHIMLFLVPIALIHMFAASAIHAQSQACRILGDPAPLNTNAQTDSGFDQAPQLSTDGDGHWITVWQSRDTLEGTIGNDQDILFATSTGGMTWSPPVALNSYANIDGDRDEGPQITTDGDGRWIAVWASDHNLSGIGNDSDILFVRSTNNGVTWSAPAPLNTNASTDTGKDSAPQLTTDGAGQWIAVWISDENIGGAGLDADVVFSRSTNGGQSWSVPALLNTNGITDSGSDEAPQLTTDLNGTWIAAWLSHDDLDDSIGIDGDILFATSTDNGMNWSAPEPLNNNAGSEDEMGDDFAPQLTTDGSGTWIAVWYSLDSLDHLENPIGNDLDIVYARSDDNGVSWSAPAPLNSIETTDASLDFTPQVTTDSAGLWVVSWESRNSLNGTIGFDSDLLSSLSTDDGLTWTNPAPLNSNAGGDGGEDAFVQVTTDGLGQWIAVWHSNTNLAGGAGDLDILTARFEFSACTDCNTNNIPDEDDIIFGLSLDCQPDGIPDECQISQDVMAQWIGTAETPGAGTWDTGANWCPDLTPVFPDNSGADLYDVTISGSDAVATLNVSPTVSTLTLEDDATVVVDDTSGANVRILASDGDVTNSGVFRATDRERLFLDAPLIDQGPISCTAGGILEATDGVAGPGEDDSKSILEINRARVIGGRAQTSGTNSEIHLIGGAELVDVCVQGIVVPDGQAAAFAGTIVNSGILRVAPDGAALTFLAPASVGGTLTGDGDHDDCVRLGDESFAHLGDFESSFTNAENHRLDGKGIIFGSLKNEGLIEANDEDGQRLLLAAPGCKDNSGKMCACKGGLLAIASKITQTRTGLIEAKEGGTALVTAPIKGEGGMLAQGGTIRFESTTASFAKCIEEPPGVFNQSRIEVIDSVITVDTPGAANNMNVKGGVFQAAQASSVSIAGPVTVCPDDPRHHALILVEDADSAFLAGQFASCAGGTVDVTGSFTVVDRLVLGNTDESEWAWRKDSRLIMGRDSMTEGAAPCLRTELEVGGEDFGTDPDEHVGDPSGFADNFDLRELVIGPGVLVDLVDNVDNGNRVDHGFGTNEALYVERLVLSDDSSRLALNGLHVYYRDIIGRPDQIVEAQRCPRGRRGTPARTR